MDEPESSHYPSIKRYETNASITIPKDVFEKMYLTPKIPVKGVLRETFGNPTTLALMGFLLSNTPIGCAAMGWRGAQNGFALAGMFYFCGGMVQIIGAIFELLLGNTFPCVVFATFGAFSFALGFTQQYVVTSSIDKSVFAATFGFALCFVGVICVMYTVCSLRTNCVLVFIFVFLSAGIFLLAASYWCMAEDSMDASQKLEKAGGACFFVYTMAGWYLLFSLLLQSVDFPLSLPVGDLSTRFKGRSARRKTKELPEV